MSNYTHYILIIARFISLPGSASGVVSLLSLMDYFAEDAALA